MKLSPKKLEHEYNNDLSKIKLIKCELNIMKTMIMKEVAWTTIPFSTMDFKNKEMFQC